MNEYYQKSIEFQEKLKFIEWNIFKTYGRELVLRLEEYNLLQNKNNCIESSTAIGFVLEEFIVSKLEMYTHCDDSEFFINRFVGATTTESYDCYSETNGIKFMINVKSEKEINSANIALASIRQLYRNYCLEEPEKEKSYIVFKVKYAIQDAYEDSEYKRAKPRCLYIKDIQTYCLEEVDFLIEHKQDNRRWSENDSAKNNGRLQISDKFRKEHQVIYENISYKNTYDMLKNIFDNNN